MVSFAWRPSKQLQKATLSFLMLSTNWSIQRVFWGHRYPWNHVALYGSETQLWSALLPLVKLAKALKPPSAGSESPELIDRCFHRRLWPFMLLKWELVWRKEVTEPALSSHFPVVCAGDYSWSQCERLVYVELCFDVEVKLYACKLWGCEAQNKRTESGR